MSDTKAGLSKMARAEIADAEIALTKERVDAATADRAGPPGEALTAAQAMMTTPATSDPTEQGLTLLRNRLSQVEHVLGMSTGADVGAVPDLHARMSEVEKIVSDFSVFFIQAEPRLASLWSHFGAKL